MKRFFMVLSLVFTIPVFAADLPDPDYFCTISMAKSKECKDGDLLMTVGEIPGYILDYCKLDSIKVVEHQGDPWVFCRYRATSRKMRK